MEKKISFGFSKVLKKPNLLINTSKSEQKDDKNKIELIKCLEGQAIQLVEEKQEEAPLVIPLKDGGKTSAALLSLRTRQAVLNGEDLVVEKKEETKHLLPEINGTANDIEKQAAREILAELGKEEENGDTSSALVLPIKPEDLPLDGAKESTMDDYDSIPITQFGKAMLRGMGWKEEPKKKGAPIEEGPILRPKGMGLGADKAIKAKALLVPPEANEVLGIKKGACIRVLGGKHKDLYGTIEGLDDHAGRIIVKMALGGCKESFNEFMVQPVSRKEYSQYSKCINSTKYEEYKRMENEYGQILPKQEKHKNISDDKPQREPSLESRVKRESDRYPNEDEKTKGSSKRYSRERDVYTSKSERRSKSRERERHNERCSRSRDRCRSDHDDDYARSSTRDKKSNRHRSKYNDYNDSESSSDSSAYRKKHKKSSKSKKSKKSKDKKHERKYSSDSSPSDERRHKKKTKKSKRGRSRSRSKGRR